MRSILNFFIINSNVHHLFLLFFLSFILIINKVLLNSIDENQKGKLGILKITMEGSLS